MSMFNYIMSFFVSNEIEIVDSIVNLDWVDSHEDEDSITHDRIYVPCATCKRSHVVGYAHKH